MEPAIRLFHVKPQKLSQLLQITLKIPHSAGFSKSSVLYKWEDGFWVAECPSLPGCVSQDKTKEEAIDNIKEAIDLYIETLQEDKLPAPPEMFEAFAVVV